MRLQARAEADISHQEDIAEFEMAEEAEASSIIFEMFQMKKDFDLVFKSHEEKHK